LLVLVLAGLISIGFVILPEFMKREYVTSQVPAGLYIASLVTLSLFVGLLISVAIERFERLMVILFVGFRIGVTAWEYQLGRHSLWYLAFSVAAHIVIGALVLLFLSGPFKRRTPPPNE
jgi:hypothetical protein